MVRRPSMQHKPTDCDQVTFTQPYTQIGKASEDCNSVEFGRQSTQHKPIDGDRKCGRNTISSCTGLSSAELILILCCAVDAGDKRLLPATFRALQTDLNATPSMLGTLNLFQSMAFSLALPVWGTLTAYYSSRDLLVAGCILWGVATAGLTFTYNIYAHCFLRAINGVGLCGVLPISQAMLIDIVPEDQRGIAFGRLGACSSLASMVTNWYAVSIQGKTSVVMGLEVHGWQVVHMQVAVASLMLAALVRYYMPAPEGGRGASASNGQGFSMSEAAATLGKILRIPSFVLLVLQGVTGGIPWNAMSFMSLYWSTCGFSDEQAGWVSMMDGIGGACGALLGGVLGDAVARRLPSRGRVWVALLSVVLGIPSFVALFYVVPRDPRWIGAAALMTFLFSLTATWTPAAANRPICAELVNSPSERAQIVAWWVTLEGVSASIFGAPLVGLLSERFGYRLDATGHATGPQASHALASALVGVALISWVSCGLVWVVMSITLPNDRARARKQLEQTKFVSNMNTEIAFT